MDETTVTYINCEVGPLDSVCTRWSTINELLKSDTLEKEIRDRLKSFETYVKGFIHETDMEVKYLISVSPDDRLVFKTYENFTMTDIANIIYYYKNVKGFEQVYIEEDWLTIDLTNERKRNYRAYDNFNI